MKPRKVREFGWFAGSVLFAFLGYLCSTVFTLNKRSRADFTAGDKYIYNGRFPFSQRALSIYEKNPEISVVAKVEFPIGKKLFHLVVNPGTWPGA